MGLDFIERAKRSITKRWDRERTRLATADLLTRHPDKNGCSAAFDMLPNAQLTTGQIVNIDTDGRTLVASIGMNIVARVADPPEHILQAVNTSHFVARGTVEKVHDVARVAEISLC